VDKSVLRADARWPRRRPWQAVRSRAVHVHDRDDSLGSVGHDLEDRDTGYPIRMENLDPALVAFAPAQLPATGDRVDRQSSK
jgi:hypothetical protein